MKKFAKFVVELEIGDDLTDNQKLQISRGIKRELRAINDCDGIGGNNCSAQIGSVIKVTPWQKWTKW